MRLLRVGLSSLLVVIVLAPYVSAIDLNFGLFKRRAAAQQTKNEPTAKVKQHLATLMGDTDVDRRKSAVVELKSIDPKANADVITGLATTLAKDPSAGVRMLAADVLGNYKIVYQSAAVALETAEVNDPDRDVRKVAKAGLLAYSKLGYQSPKDSVEVKPNFEPPLAKKPAKLPPSIATTTSTSAKVAMPKDAANFLPITQGSAKPANKLQQSEEPPLLSVKKPTTIASPQPLVVPQIMPAKDALPTLPQPGALSDNIPGGYELPTIPTLPGKSSIPTVVPPTKK